MLQDKNDLNSCGLSFAFNNISGKWKPFIIWYLFSSPEGVCRYGELKRKIPWDISHKMFSQQLTELEQAKIINRIEYDEKPLRVEYSLTEAGKLLAPAILYLRDWGTAFGEQFTCEDLVSRTLAEVHDSNFYYGYNSEELGKSVSICFSSGGAAPRELK